jgi:hypothetical protein
MARLGTDELAEWLAFDRVYPLPDPWMAAAIVARTAAWAMGAKGRALALDRYYWPEMVQSGRPRHQTTAEMMAAWEGIVARQNRNGGP